MYRTSEQKSMEEFQRDKESLLQKVHAKQSAYAGDRL